jgi:predicted metal-dependent hydrolase
LKIIHQKQPRKRSYSLRLDFEGNLIIKTNYSYGERDVQKIVEKHKDWIEKRVKEFENAVSYSRLNLADGEAISVLGETYFIKIIESKLKRPKISIKENHLMIERNVDALNEEIKSALQKYFISISKDLFIEKVYFYAGKYGFEYNKIAVKTVRSKWGSCSSKKNLNFDWKLIFCPANIMDYVIIHEICHLKEMNHSSRFWDLVAKECPDYKVKRKWLKTEGEKIKFLLN